MWHRKGHEGGAAESVFSAKWAAPEVLEFGDYSSSSDVWSYGCVLFEIWSMGNTPFSEHSEQQVGSTQFSYYGVLSL